MRLLCDLCVFSVVMADAAMVERVISVDAMDAAPQRHPATAVRRGRVAGSMSVMQQRDIEGGGGCWWRLGGKSHL